MQHPDEGTIHAWLDGQLPAEEAAQLEAHVATCADCSARVADARGLVAASSRIVSALDHTPGGVIPIQSKRARRLWITPAITAIAATVVLAAGTLLVQKREAPKTEAVNVSPLTAAVADTVASTAQAPSVQTKAMNRQPPRVAGADARLSHTDVGPQPRPRAMEERKLAAAPPTAAPLPASPVPAEKMAAAEVNRDSMRMQRASVARTLAGGMGGGRASSSGSFAPGAAPAAARAAEPMAVADKAIPTMIGCYEASESRDVLPRRFALLAGGEVRYVDSTGKRDGVIVDVSWVDSAQSAIIRNRAGRELLRIRRVANEVVVDTPLQIQPVACH